jgi:hypothetical protein
VSTILKALKKLENDVPGEDKEQFRIQDIDTREAISKRAKKRQMTQRTVLTLLVVFALSGSVGLLTFGWMSVGKKRFQEPSPLGKDISGALLTKKAHEDEQFALVPEEIIKHKNTEAGKSNEKALKKGLKKEAPPNILTIKETPAVKKPDHTRVNIKEYLIEDKLPPEKIVEESWLKLQAISWSSNPEKRIAVINNHVVREGGSVEDGTVARIEKEYVVIDAKGEEWQLKFRLRR